MRLHSIFLLIVMTTLLGCAGRYHGYGIEEELFHPNGATIELRSPGIGKIQDFLMLRAAEITRERGYQYFVVTGADAGIRSPYNLQSQRHHAIRIRMFGQPPQTNEYQVFVANDVIRSTREGYELGESSSS